MNFGDVIKSAADSVIKYVSDNSPRILAGIAISSGVLATAFSIKGTVKAVRIVDEKKKELNKEKLTVGETIKYVWPCYIPSFILTVVSAASGIGVVQIGERREAAAIALWRMSETTLSEYKEKTKELLGAKKEQEIHDEVNKDKAVKVLNNTSEIINTNHGNVLFIEAATGQKFRASKNFIDSVINKFQYRINNENARVDLNDILMDLGLNRADLANKVIWDINYPIEHYVTYLTVPGEDGEPVGYLEFTNYYDCDLPWR